MGGWINILPLHVVFQGPLVANSRWVLLCWSTGPRGPPPRQNLLGRAEFIVWPLRRHYMEKPNGIKYFCGSCAWVSIHGWPSTIKWPSAKFWLGGSRLDTDALIPRVRPASFASGGCYAYRLVLGCLCSWQYLSLGAWGTLIWGIPMVSSIFWDGFAWVSIHGCHPQ